MKKANNHKSKFVVIRDDDINFFTPVKYLDTLYRPVLERGGKVALSIIPSVACGMRVGDSNGLLWQKYKLDYSPFVPPAFRRLKKEFSVGDNHELVSYIRANPGYEIVQHGFNHLKTDAGFEGICTDICRIEANVAESASIMKNAFGKKARFFVGPWDAFSMETIKILKKYFMGISMHRLGKRHVPWYLKPAAVIRQIIPRGRKKGYFKWGNFLIFEYPHNILSMFNDPAIILPQIKTALEQVDLLVLVTHHWEFFYDWNGLNKPFFDAWRDVMEFLLDNDFITVSSFDDIYHKINCDA